MMQMRFCLIEVQGFADSDTELKASFLQSVSLLEWRQLLPAGWGLQV